MVQKPRAEQSKPKAKLKAYGTFCFAVGTEHPGRVLLFDIPNAPKPVLLKFFVSAFSSFRQIPGEQASPN
jgi:hypothetical protein